MFAKGSQLEYLLLRKFHNLRFYDGPQTQNQLTIGCLAGFVGTLKFPFVFGGRLFGRERANHWLKWGSLSSTRSFHFCDAPEFPT
jgi:hypothetical protein